MLTKSFDFLENRIGSSGPNEGACFGVVGSDEVIDLRHQFFDAAERAATNGFLGDDVEPNFDLVEPGSVGRREVNLVAGMGSQPTLDARMLVRGVVVHDQVNSQPSGDVGIDLPEKVQVFLVTMATAASAHHLAAGQVQGGEQRGRAVTEIVMRHPFNITQAPDARFQLLCQPSSEFHVTFAQNL
jgi:hypothetical protein